MDKLRVNSNFIALDKIQDYLHWIWGGIVCLSLVLAFILDFYLIAGLPLAFLLVYVTIVDFRKVYYLLLVSIPISTEFYFPGGFGTDLPTEPLMIGLMGTYILYIINNVRDLDLREYKHPLTLLLIIHLFWIYTTTITSDLLWVSLKFSLSKTWYVISLFFFSTLLLRTKKAIKNFFWCIFIPLMITVLITLLRHAMIGFSFQDVHTIFHPFHRNHVNYAALIALFFPFVINALSWYPRKSTTWYLIALCIPILLIATYLSFTRAAYVALIIAGACYFVFKWKLIRYAILAAIIIAPMVVNYVVEDNKYLEFAPDYNRTVTHTKFNNLIDATYKGEDISTMERVYRWVAGGHMVSAHPLVGVGPGNFVNFYRSYTVNSFQTYVSDNEDNSGIHSYYLMTMVEQGIPGLLIYLLLCFATLIMGERIYHRLVDPFWKNTVMAALLCMIIIDAFQIINDMLETDKMGPFFFFTIAILIVADLHHRKKRFRGLNSKN